MFGSFVSKITALVRDAFLAAVALVRHSPVFALAGVLAVLFLVP